MKRTYLTITLALLIAVLTVSAVAEPQSGQLRRGHGTKGPGKMQRGGFGDSAGFRTGMLLRLKDKLGLTEEQVKQLEAVREEAKGQFKASAEAVKAKRQALGKAVESGADETAIRVAAAELGTAIGDQAVLKAGNKAKVDAILTDEQKTKLEELKQQRTQKMQKMGKKQKGRKESARPKGPEAMFSKIDTDGDGAISLEEFTNHAEQMRNRQGRSEREPREHRGRRRPSRPDGPNED